jgi:hypothetical protein
MKTKEIPIRKVGVDLDNLVETMRNGGVHIFDHQIWHPFVRFIFITYGTWYILRRDCLLKHVVEARLYGTGRRERRSNQLLDDLKENRRY